MVSPEGASGALPSLAFCIDQVAKGQRSLQTCGVLGSMKPVHLNCLMLQYQQSVVLTPNEEQAVSTSAHGLCDGGCRAREASIEYSFLQL